MIPDQQVVRDFDATYGTPPTYLSQAPGRVNLMGDHVDYNGGFVLPAAIDFGIKLAARPRAGSVLRLASSDYHDSASIDLAQPLVAHPHKQGWPSYVLAVVDQFARRGIAIPGMELLISGDVPRGAGLSSSAALEVAVATLLNEVAEAGLSNPDLALLAQAAEHSPFVGVQCGIMDQFASALGVAGHALMLDCNSLAFEQVPFDSTQAVLLIIDSKRQRGLVESEYNLRRRQCEEGLQILSAGAGATFASLRDVPYEMFLKRLEALPPRIARRLTHVFSENIRVLACRDLLQASDWPGLGQAFYQSHESLRDHYEVSCPELDVIVGLVSAYPADGAYGCRMTGAGFGGCAVALVQPSAVEAISSHVRDGYRSTFGVEPAVYVARPSNGAGVRCLATEGSGGKPRP